MQDKIVVVTGGGSGIGRATCERLAEEGAYVVVGDCDEASGRATADRIRQADGVADFLFLDVAVEASVAKFAAEIDRLHGKVHSLVNNAAVFVLHGIDATPDHWRRSLDVNVMGPALVAKHVVPLIRKAGGGTIVNLGSISSFLAQPNFLTYNATKAAIATMTRCMALDLAGDGIRVNAVCPGTVWTPIVEKITKQAGLDRQTADTDPSWGGACFLKRIAEPREIAQAILFLASDEASYITGAHLMVDGGYSAQ
jgi:dihydroanticapsin dehydrogenase